MRSRGNPALYSIVRNHARAIAAGTVKRAPPQGRQPRAALVLLCLAPKRFSTDHHQAVGGLPGEFKLCFSGPFFRDPPSWSDLVLVEQRGGGL